MITGGSGYSVDIAAISGTPGLSVVLVDENQKILSWNGTAADLFGVPAAQALGQPVGDIAGQPRTVTGLGRESLAGVIAAEGGWSGSLLYQRQDGSEFLLQAAGLRVPRSVVPEPCGCRTCPARTAISRRRARRWRWPPLSAGGSR